jgi:hypothetical protein
VFRRILFILILVFSVPLVLALGTDDALEDIGLPGFDVISPFVDSNRYTHEKTDRIAVNDQTIFADATTIRTDAGDLHVDQKSLALQIRGESGYLWSSAIDTNRYDVSMSFSERAQSALIIESFNVQTTNYAITEENIFQPGTTIDFHEIDNGFEAMVVFGRSKIGIRMIVTYDANGLRIRIPESGIREEGDFRIASLKVYPYFGAVYEDDTPGYVFLPDGVGALIDHKAADPLVSSNYLRQIYGRSIGYNTLDDMSDFVTGGARIYAPVFGTVHGVDQNALFASIESGAAYGRINYYFPFRNRGFSNVFTDFVYRRTYAQPIDRSGNTISLLQDFRNPVDIDLTYHVLDGAEANYVGMANRYRDVLFGDREKPEERSDIPIRLDFIGLEKKDGLLFTETTLMTTLSDMIGIVEALNRQDIDHIYANILGFDKDGVTWAPPDYGGLSRKIGTDDELRELQKIVESLSYGIEVMKASDRSRGYNRYVDLAKKINDGHYAYASATDTKYVLDYDKVEDVLVEGINRYEKEAIDALSLSSVGSLLYGDFANDRRTRDLIVLLQDTLRMSGLPIYTHDTNSYLWKSSDAIFDMPMFSSQYVTFDDTVPFLSMVLGGNVPLFAPYANFYPYPRDDLLRLIDFNVYPSFVMTDKSTKYLQETALESIYSAKFSDIERATVTYYDFVNGALKHVVGADMINREVLGSGVVKTTYDNGVSMIINYGDTPYDDGSVRVLAKNYLVRTKD